MGLNRKPVKKLVDIEKLEKVLFDVKYLYRHVNGENENVDMEYVKKELGDIHKFLVNDVLELDNAEKNEFKRFIYNCMVQKKNKGELQESKKLYDVYKKIDKLSMEEEEPFYWELYFKYLEDKGRGNRGGKQIIFYFYK